MFDEPGSFFICTETSPRCYIIQKVSSKQVDTVVEQLKTHRAAHCSATDQCPSSRCNSAADAAHAQQQPQQGRQPATPPPLPCLPTWFTADIECDMINCTGELYVAGDGQTSKGAAFVHEFNGLDYVNYDSFLGPECPGWVPPADAQLAHGQPQIHPGGTLRMGQPKTGDADSGISESNGPAAVSRPAALPLLTEHSGTTAAGSSAAPVKGAVADGKDRDEGVVGTGGDLVDKLRQQFEYYFSHANLSQDQYLWSQMDSDNYVTIETLASFPRIRKLTSSRDTIMKALKSSPKLQVDEKNMRVRAAIRRTTILLRDVPEPTEKEEIVELFKSHSTVSKCPSPETVEKSINNSWYVTFGSEEETRKAYFHLTVKVGSFKGQPVSASIKATASKLATPLQKRSNASGGGGTQQHYMSSGLEPGAFMSAAASPGQDQPWLVPQRGCPQMGGAAAAQQQQSLGAQQGAWPPPFDAGPVLMAAGYQATSYYRPVFYLAPPHFQSNMQPTFLPQAQTYESTAGPHSGQRGKSNRYQQPQNLRHNKDPSYRGRNSAPSDRSSVSGAKVYNTNRHSYPPAEHQNTGSAEWNTGRGGGRGGRGGRPHRGAGYAPRGRRTDYSVGANVQQYNRAEYNTRYYRGGSWSRGGSNQSRGGNYAYNPGYGSLPRSNAYRNNYNRSYNNYNNQGLGLPQATEEGAESAEVPSGGKKLAQCRQASGESTLQPRTPGYEHHDAYIDDDCIEDVGLQMHGDDGSDAGAGAAAGAQPHPKQQQQQREFDPGDFPELRQYNQLGMEDTSGAEYAKQRQGGQAAEAADGSYHSTGQGAVAWRAAGGDAQSTRRAAPTAAAATGHVDAETRCSYAQMAAARRQAGQLQQQQQQGRAAPLSPAPADELPVQPKIARKAEQDWAGVVATKART